MSAESTGRPRRQHQRLIATKTSAAPLPPVRVEPIDSPDGMEVSQLAASLQTPVGGDIITVPDQQLSPPQQLYPSQQAYWPEMQQQYQHQQFIVPPPPYDPATLSQLSTFVCQDQTYPPDQPFSDERVASGAKATQMAQYQNLIAGARTSQPPLPSSPCHARQQQLVQPFFVHPPHVPLGAHVGPEHAAHRTAAVPVANASEEVVRASMVREEVEVERQKRVEQIEERRAVIRHMRRMIKMLQDEIDHLQNNAWIHLIQ